MTEPTPTLPETPPQPDTGAGEVHFDSVPPASASPKAAEAAKPGAAKTPVPPVPPPPYRSPPPVRAATPEATQPLRSALPVLTAVGFIFVLVILAWIWNSQVNMRLRIAELSVPPPPTVEPSRVAALEARVKVLEQRIGEIESRPPPAPVVSSESSAALNGQLTELATRLKATEQRESALAERAGLAQKMQQALAALDGGEPLGDLPGAPPALAKFARTRPPTEASLRLSFPAAAAAAEEASKPPTDGKSLGERILLHASALVTVKKGNQVLVGAPAATVLGEAESRVEAGDLAGALGVLDALDSGAAKAMAGWRDEAKALLDARAALTQMVRG